MKTIISIILFLIVLSLAMILLPLCIAVIVAMFKSSNGNIMGGIVAIVMGIVIQLIWSFCIFNGDIPESEEDGECPNCGNSATDGNYCYECGDEF